MTTYQACASVWNQAKSKINKFYAAERANADAMFNERARKIALAYAAQPPIRDVKLLANEVNRRRVHILGAAQLKAGQVAVGQISAGMAGEMSKGANTEAKFKALSDTWKQASDRSSQLVSAMNSYGITPSWESTQGSGYYHTTASAQAKASEELSILAINNSVTCDSVAMIQSNIYSNLEVQLRAMEAALDSQPLSSTLTPPAYRATKNAAVVYRSFSDWFGGNAQNFLSHWEPPQAQVKNAMSSTLAAVPNMTAWPELGQQEFVDSEAGDLPIFVDEESGRTLSNMGRDGSGINA